MQQPITMYTNLVFSVSSTNLVNIFQRTGCAIMITFDILTLQKLCDYFCYVLSFQKRGEMKITCTMSILSGNGAIAEIYGCVSAQE